jgi:hypothetical protein
MRIAEMTPEPQERRRASWRRYGTSEKGRAAHCRYMESPQGRMTRSEHDASRNRLYIGGMYVGG